MTFQGDPRIVDHISYILELFVSWLLNVSVTCAMYLGVGESDSDFARAEGGAARYDGPRVE